MSMNNRKTAGPSRLKTAYILLFIAFIGVLGTTKYLELSTDAREAVEEGVVAAVRQGLADRDAFGNVPAAHPDTLDTAEKGAATPSNRFFAHVLEKDIAVAGWSKTGTREYQAPSGIKYEYDPKKGTFEAK